MPGLQARTGARTSIADAVERVEAEFGLRAQLEFAGPVDRALSLDAVDDIVGALRDALQQLAAGDRDGVVRVAVVAGAGRRARGVVRVCLQFAMAPSIDGRALARWAQRAGSFTEGTETDGRGRIEWTLPPTDLAPSMSSPTPPATPTLHTPATR
jgi:hypothetical protein